MLVLGGFFCLFGFFREVEKVWAHSLELLEILNGVTTYQSSSAEKEWCSEKNAYFA